MREIIFKKSDCARVCRIFTKMRKIFIPRLIRLGRIIKNKQGYTLIELTVSMAVIVIISSIALVNFSGHDRRNKVDLAAYKLASDIRKVQGYALSLKEFTGDVPEGGWGISFSKNNTDYLVYGDGEGAGDTDYYYDNNDEDYEIIKFPDGIKILTLNCSGGTAANGNKNKSCITFEPPEPEIHISGNNDGQDDYKVFVIALSDGAHARTVKINKFGLVDVE